MRKIEAQMINAVRACLNGEAERVEKWQTRMHWGSGNTAVYVKHDGVVVVMLHGNVIAEFDSALCGARNCRGLKLDDCGWRTNTTKSRLNALLGAFREGSRIYQKKGEWFSPQGEPWTGSDWFSYGIWDNPILQAAERIGNSKPRIENAYDADWHHAMSAVLATAKRFPAEKKEVIVPSTGFAKAAGL